MLFRLSPLRPLSRLLFVLVTLIVSNVLVIGGLSRVASAEEGESGPSPSNVAKEALDSDGDGDLDRPDAVSASSTAVALKKPVEDLSQRTETVRVFATPDGSWKSREYLAPVRVQQDDEWVDVDLSLVKQPDGSWAPKASPVDVSVDGGGAREAARITFEDGESLAVTWPEELPEPTIDGGVATYAVSSTTDLVVTVTNQGVNTHIRLNQAPAAGDPILQQGVFELGLRSDDLEVKESGDRLKLTDDEGQTLGRTTPLVAWDAKTDDAGSPTELVPLETTLKETSSSGDVTNQSLELKTPEGYLSDPNTQYPVVIDPALANTYPIRDTWVRDGDGNHGSENYLVIGKINGSSNTAAAAAYLKFYTGSQLQGKTVLSATLGLFQYYAYTCSAKDMYIHGVTTPWDGNLGPGNIQPSTTPTGGVIVSANRGAAGCANGWTTASIPIIAQGWANNSIPNEGLRLVASNTTQSSFERRFCAMDMQAGAYCGTPDRVPYLDLTYNTPPYAPSAVSISPTTSIGSTLVTTASRPKFSVQLTDAEPNDDIGGVIRIVNSGGAVVTDEWTPTVKSGQTATKRLDTTLADGTYTALSFAADGAQFGAAGPNTTFKVDTTPPPTPTVTCTGGVTSGTWYTTRPTSSTTCTATSNSEAVTLEWTSGNKPQETKTPNSAGASVLGTFAIPTNGVLDLSVRARDAAGNLSAPGDFGFGVGAGATVTPVDGERTSSTVLTEGEGPAGASSARIEHRPAGSAEATAWVAATNVKPEGSNFPWLGNVASTTSQSVTTGKLIWDISAETGVTKPSVRETRVCFIYAGVSKCTPSRDVTVVPAAFGSSFPTQAAGPGQVALFTGEFQLSESDVEVPTYSGTLSLGRSHRSYAGQVSPSAGVFGPGWVADLQGPEAGAGSAEVVDNTTNEASITLVSPDGTSGTYTHEDYAAAPQLQGYYNGNAETKTENNLLELFDDGTTKKLMLNEADGTETTWTHVGSGKWVVEKVVEPQNTGTTTYTHDAQGLVTGIYAPAPAGVTCNATTQAAGCRALWLTYTTVGSAKRLEKIDLRIWDPKPTSTGAPNLAAAGMTTTTVQRYAYNINGTLKETWDPRLDGTSGPLKTAYEYATIGTKTVLTKATPPGQTPWRFEYATTGAAAGKFQSAKRAHPAGVGSGDATWNVVYETALSGAGLPDLRQSATTTWGQTAAPVAGAIVFGPDASGTADATYGSISYWDVEGRTTNTATYGAGDWQIDSSAYDAKGNVIWALGEGNRNAALVSLGVSAATANSLATLTIYNEEAPGIPAGTRVEKIYGPTRQVMLKNGNLVDGRSYTATTYDDEAIVDGVPADGRPTPVAGEPAANLTMEERTQTVDAAGNAFDLHRTRYRYDPVLTGDGNGWKLGTPTRVMTQLDAGWSTTLTRSDSEGRIIETRSPQAVGAPDGTADDARSTKTIYYTADASSSDSACQSKPEWAGLECIVKSGDTRVPVSRTTGFDYLLNATRAEETAGTISRASVTLFDPAGRKTTDQTTVSGAPASDLAVPNSFYTYSPTTGAQVSTTTSTATLSKTYDDWGRVLTQSDGTGNTAITTYDTADRVKTFNDGKGTYTYTYDGTDAAGRIERRGLVTKLDVGLATGPDEFQVASNADGASYLTKYPNGIQSTTQFDQAGDATALTYADAAGSTIAAFSNTLDAQSRVRLARSPGSTQAYTYDDRSRLTTVQDTTAGGCVTRQYTLSLDSNRTALATSGPAANGSCTTAAPATSLTDFDALDRITNPGYTYDSLGRTRTVPASHTDQPTSGALTVAYYGNDMVGKLSQTVGSVAKSKSFTIDAVSRLSQTSDVTGGVEVRKTVNHYAGSDSPAWIATESRPNTSVPWESGWVRSVLGPNGDLAIAQSSTGTAKIQLTNLHGDIVATVDAITYAGLTSFAETTEYGLTKAGAPSIGQYYGWHGSKRRSTDSIGGLTLMGLRLYNPVTGRFLSRDPVPGGNDNTYIYPADPINQSDITGTWCVFGAGTSCKRYTKDARGKKFHATAAKRQYIKKHNIDWKTVKSIVKNYSEIWKQGNTTQYRARIYEQKCLNRKKNCSPTGNYVDVRVSVRFKQKGDEDEFTGLKTAYCEGTKNGSQKCPDYVSDMV